MSAGDGEPLDTVRPMAETITDLQRANNRFEEEARAARRTNKAMRETIAAIFAGHRFDFAAHLARQRAWSEETFGPGARTKGVIDHIRKELAEIEADPADVEEWIDVVILALDGAWRAGFTPLQIIDTLEAKQSRNERRDWPDWRTASPDHAIEHVRTERTNARAESLMVDP
ncbi:MAG: dATP/dGTP pyrophosphohydrolase domain-containing protein [Pararhodobacter sp.]